MRRRTFPNFIGNVYELQERQDRLERVMRVIGFSPEKPYTLNVNDGTRNTVQIGLVDGVYGIKIVDNAGSEIILANGTIVADAIKTGTLDCGLITVSNLDAGVITTGYLEATRIQGGTLNCGTMTVSNLNAGSITVGTFVSINDRLTAQAIHGEKLQVGTVNANRIVANSISAGQISAHSISGNEIAFGTLTGDHLNVRTITADRIQTGSITTTEINYVSGSKLVSNSVTHDKISVTNLSAINANLGTVTAGTINGLTINAGYGGGGLNLYGDAFSIKDSGGTSRGKFFASGLSLRIESYGGVIQIAGYLSFDNTSGTGWFVPGCSEATRGDKLTLYNNLDCNEYSIDACDTIWAYNFNNRCKIAEGIDPFEVMKSFKADSKDKNIGWKKLDHSKLHKSIYAKTIHKKKKIVKGKTIEEEKLIEGYDLGKLVELQRVAILQLKNELELLKEKIK